MRLSSHPPSLRTTVIRTAGATGLAIGLCFAGVVDTHQRGTVGAQLFELRAPLGDADAPNARALSTSVRVLQLGRDVTLELDAQHALLERLDANTRRLQRTLAEKATRPGQRANRMEHDAAEQRESEARLALDSGLRQAHDTAARARALIAQIRLLLGGAPETDPQVEAATRLETRATALADELVTFERNRLPH
jgi:hypothetical protein